MALLLGGLSDLRVVLCRFVLRCLNFALYRVDGVDSGGAYDSFREGMDDRGKVDFAALRGDCQEGFRLPEAQIKSPVFLDEKRALQCRVEPGEDTTRQQVTGLYGQSRRRFVWHLRANLSVDQIFQEA